MFIKELSIKERFLNKLYRGYKNIEMNSKYFLYKNQVPLFLRLEMVNVCNSKCIFCSSHLIKDPVPAFLKDDYFYKAVDEFKGAKGRNISLNSIRGEMFIDPKILDRLRYIKNLDFEFVFCYTNGTLLHKFDINEILNSGLTEMHISIAPLIEEIYTKIYVNKKYKQLLENLRNLLKTFNESREKTVKKIWIEFRSDRPLSECLLTPDYLEYISPYVTNDIIIVALTKFDSMNGTIKEEDLLPGMEIENDETSNMSFFPCANSSSIVIKSTGDVKICGCRYLIEGHDDEFLLGHIKNNTIIELYNSDIVRKMKIKFILNGQLGLCRKCTGYGVYLFQFAQRLS